MKMKMEIRVLEYYITIVEQKSITRAAQVLHISQSTLSRQIMDLESQLGVTVFERGHRGITITEDGDFLYQRAKEILQLTDDTEQHLIARKTLSGILRMGIGEGEVNDFILQAVRPIIEENKNVRLDYQTLSADKIFRYIDLGLIDFGVVWAKNILPQFDSLDLPYENHWGAVVRADDSLAEKKSLVANDLNQHQLILPQQLDVKSDLQKYLKEYAAGVRVTGYYDMNYNMLSMVKAGIGAALTLSKPEYKQMKDFVFIPLNYLNPIGVRLIWKTNRKKTRLSQAFLEKITQQLDT